MDMHIERDVALGGMQAMQGAASSRGSMHSSPSLPRQKSAVASTGFELAAEPSNLRGEDDDRVGPSIGARIAGLAVAAVLFGGAAFGLVRVAHHPSGMNLTRVMPHAFDGTSTIDAGGVAIALLIAAIAIGFAGVKVRPRSWAFVASAAAMFLAAIAMVTAALGSGPENTTPPDGVLLMPYLIPVGFIGVGLGVAGRGAAAFAMRSIARKLAVVPLAAIGAAIAFLGFEISAFVSMLH
jgi:hypothetical protein